MPASQGVGLPPIFCTCQQSGWQSLLCLPLQLPELLRLLLDRLRNEITRLASVRAFTVLAGGELQGLHTFKPG